MMVDYRGRGQSGDCTEKAGCLEEMVLPLRDAFLSRVNCSEGKGKCQAEGCRTESRSLEMSREWLRI